MIMVDPYWWQSLFDDVYLLTDAPFVSNPPLTRREVDMVEHVVPLHPTDRILDLCGGQGRHALELAQRGYRHVMVLDYAPLLLQRGHWAAVEAGVAIQFCRGDARQVPLRPASVDVVLVMANSSGYFAEAADDQRMLAEVARVLRRGGQVLLDLTDDHVLRQHFLSESWHEATADVVVCWKRELVGDIVRVRELVLSKAAGVLRDRTYAERLYSPERLCTLLAEVGLVDPTVHRNAFVYHPDDGTDYGLATHRMLITAIKGSP